MRDTTTVRISIRTRDDLRELADHDGQTLEQTMAALIRAERQRRMGKALATEPSQPGESEWLDLGSGTVADHAGG